MENYYTRPKKKKKKASSNAQSASDEFSKIIKKQTMKLKNF